MPYSPLDAIKPHRVYLVLYDLYKNQWALAVRSGEGVFLLDAVLTAGQSQPRRRYWEFDSSKKSAIIMCNAMDLKDDDGVQSLLTIAAHTSTDMYGIRGRWAEAVLRKGSDIGFSLSADIARIQEIIMYEATKSSQEDEEGLVRVIEIS